MKAIKGSKENVAEGRRLEQAGDLSEAAGVYQKIVDHDEGNQEAVGRLLVIYRKMKEYSKELAVIKGALAAVEQRDKALQEKWIKAHPKAAGAGRAMFRKLGGAEVSAADPMVTRLLKRKAFVEKRLGRGKPKKRAIIRRIAAKGRGGRKKSLVAESGKSERKAAIAARKEEAAAVRLRADEQRRQKAEAREAEKQKTEAAKAEKQAAAEARKAEAAAKAKAEQHPSLFVVSLRYLVPLEEIDAAMPRHMKFLNKYYEQGNFLVSGRQVPRTGGTIITRGKNRAAVERIMKSDPFVKGKMASMDIIEFSASRVGKGLKL
jgi:uncharacterized protein YciI